MELMRSITSAWMSVINKASKVKESEFGDDAEEAMRFFDGPYDFLYDSKNRSGHGFDWGTEDGVPRPRFKMTFNKVAETVQLFGPALYHRNPYRQVNPAQLPNIPMLDPQDPQSQIMMQQLQQSDLQRGQRKEMLANLLQSYINYTPNELDLRGHSRQVIDETLIKGMGCLSGGTEVYARLDGRITVIRIRDLHRVDLDRTCAELWNGSLWTRVMATRVKKRKGDELKVTLRSGEEVNCTANHPWPTQRGLLRADELEVGDRFSYEKLEGSRHIAGDHLPDEIGWLVGLYLGDGSIAADKRDVVFQIAGHSNEKARGDRLEKVVAQYGGQVSWRRSSENGLTAIVSSRILVAVLREYVCGDGSDKKHLKTTCWERSDAFLKHLWEGYLAADGHQPKTSKNGAWRLGFCRNKQLAQSIRTLCARLGIKLTLKLNRQKVTPGHRSDGKKTVIVYRGYARQEAKPETDLGEIVSIDPADWRCDKYYDIQVEDDPHTYCLASGLVTHNCWWTLPYRPPGSSITLIGSFYDSIDHLIIDPDMESIESAKWIARKRCMPVWDVERRFGMRKGDLRGNLESRSMQSQISADPDSYNDAHRRGDSNDLFTYWEVYSRMGVGHKLKVSNSERFALPAQDAYNRTFDRFGEHCFLAVCDECPYPLNLPSASVSTKEAFMRMQWPTPFWADPTNPWPFSYAAFHKVPRKVWPMSHIKPALGEIKFLNWMFSFLADKVKNTSRDFIGVMKSAGEEIKSQILNGRDLSLIEIESTHGKTIADVVSFLQHPSFNGDVWKIAEMMMGLLERRLGLNELMYGESKRQLRSASEAQIKGDQLRIRPDDMAECIEEAMTKVARKEALAARWHLEPQDVAPMLGPERAMMWAQVVQDANIQETVLELDYRIEAGSIRKPNRNRDQENANNSIQSLAPLFTKYFEMTGDVGPINTVLAMFAKAFDLPADKFQLQPPPPPQPDPQEMMKAEAEQQKQQAEIQKMQMEMQQQAMEAQAKLVEMQAKLQNDRELMEAKLEGERQKMVLEFEKMRMQMMLDQQEHAQEMRQDQQVHEQEMQQSRQAGQQQLELQEKQSDAKVEATRKAAAAKPAAATAKKAPAKKSKKATPRKKK